MTLAELERENDKALITYWQAVLYEEECENALSVSKEAQALHLAKGARAHAQDEMSKARLKYLTAKVSQ